MKYAWVKAGCLTAVLLGAATAFGSERDWEWDYTGEGSSWGGGRPGESRALRPATNAGTSWGPAVRAKDEMR